MTVDSSTQVAKEQPAQLRTGKPDTAWFVVVGFDGSDPSRAALEVATDLIRGRDGHLEVVYVAHLPMSVTISASAVLSVREGFDVIASELADTARAALDDREPRWHFERRDGSVADELIAAAREVRRRNGIESRVVIVVGSARHVFPHALGTAATLTHSHEFPLLVVPLVAGAGPTTQADDAAGESQLSQPASDDDILVDRNNAEQVLSRAGFLKSEIADVLGSVTFPAPLSAVVLRGQQFGISAGSLMERLGSSP